jgi:hypothetical protein
MPAMAKNYRIELSDLDLGQLLNGLQMRAERWESTAEYLSSGYVADGYIVEECSKPEEADGIAAHYRSIIAKIQTRMEAQR